MKPESKAPTPAELASFIAATGIETYCAGDPIDESVSFSSVFYQGGFRDRRFFSRAVEAWNHWERGIAEASEECADGLARGAEMVKPVPLAQCMRELSIFDERTAKDLFCAAYKNTIPTIGLSQRIGGLWSNARHSGIQRRLVDAMRAERDRRAVERARKGGAAKAEKQRKKFEQEKAGEIQQQAAPTQQQAGKKRTPRRSKRKP